MICGLKKKLLGENATMSILGMNSDDEYYWDLGEPPTDKRKVCTGETGDGLDVTSASNYVAGPAADEVADLTVCEFSSPTEGCSDPIALNFKDTVSSAALNATCQYPMFEIPGPGGDTKFFRWKDLSQDMKAYHLHQLESDDLANADDEEERPFEFDPQIMTLVYVGAGLLGLGLIAYMYKTAKSKK